MNGAIVVGRTAATKCSVAVFNSVTEVWAIDSGFPDIAGSLYGVYSITKEDIWVCGHTGSVPILYHWDGSTWTNHSSEIAAIDASVSLTDIDGSSTTNIYCAGNNGAVYKYDGSTWSKVFTNPYATSINICVNSVNGKCYTGGHWYNYTDQSGSWALIKAYNSQLKYHKWAEIESGNLLCYRQNTSWWPDSVILEIRPTCSTAATWAPTGGIATVHPTVYTGLTKNADDFWYWQESTDLVGHCVNRTAVNYSGAGNPWSHDIRAIAIGAADDVWICGHFDVSWDNCAQLSHWNGSTWSNPADYNSNIPNSLFWEDISISTNVSPYLISSPVSPNPGYYTDTPMTWKIGQN